MAEYIAKGDNRFRSLIQVCTVQYHVERTHDFMMSNTPMIL
jgi:hypothetical protein